MTSSTRPDTTPARFQAGLHRFSIGTAVATVFLIFAGGMVTSTGSGLSVPDWPLSYGMVMPPMVGGIFYEHGHRMVATTVGLLMTIQALWMWRAEPRPWLRRLAAVAWLLVVAQGVLGGMTVLFKLPVAISVAHACTAQAFLGIAVSMAVFTSRGWVEGRPRVEGPGDLPMTTLSTLIVGALFLQLLLGAVMRHTGAGLAIMTFPLFSDLPNPPVNFYTAIHYSHRLGAVLVSSLVLFATARVLRRPEAHPRLTGLAFSMLLTVLAQASLGVMTILTYKRADITSLHVMTGAVLMALAVCQTLFARRTLVVYDTPRAPARQGAAGRLVEEPST